MLRKIDRLMIRQLQEHAGVYGSLVFALLIGILCGAFTPEFLQSGMVDQLKSYADAFWSASAAGDLAIASSMMHAGIVRALQFLYVYFFGLFLATTPLLYLGFLGLGFSIGICSGILFQGLGIKAILALTAGMLPGLLFALPALLYSGCTSLCLLRGQNALQRQRKQSNWLYLRAKAHLRELSPAGWVMVLGVVVEGALSPLLLRLFASMIP